MTALDYLAFDADNHYYEAIDAFTRHLDPKLGPRCVQWAEIGGRKYHVVGGRVSHAVVNPTFDPVAKAGVLHEYFRGNPRKLSPVEYLKEREPIRPEYRDRDARLRVMDEQGLEAMWLFPTLGILYEELLKHDPEAVSITFRAFNQYLLEDWGFAYQDRIFCAPYIAMAQRDSAVRELDWALDHGARVVVMRVAVPQTVDGPQPVSRGYWDPFWARVNEAGVTVVVHAGDSGYTSHGYGRDGFSASFGNQPAAPNPVGLTSMERPIQDMLAAMICDKLFDRFPNVRIASVENGSDFLAYLFKKLASLENKMPGWFREHPVETFRKNIWINPFWEDDVNEIVRLMGPERVIFGSDWPHIEGMPEPLDYVSELVKLDDAAQQLILRDNTRELTALRPA